MRTTTQYRRFSSAEREETSRGLAQGNTISAIAGRLGRAPSTRTREVNRNSGTSGYRAFSAGKRAFLNASSRRGGKNGNTAERNTAGREILRKHEVKSPTWSPLRSARLKSPVALYRVIGRAISSWESTNAPRWVLFKPLNIIHS